MMKQNDLKYTNKYTNLSRESLLGRIKEVMSEKRFNHVLRVEQTALELAEKHDADIEKVSIAALTHDYAKEQDDEEMRDMVISENMDLELLEFGNNIWHGPVGAVLVEKQLRVTDEEILDAVRKHTIGSPKMGLIDKIIYVADYIEPARDFPAADEARKIAEKSLDEAVSYITRETMKNLIHKNVKIYPVAIETYNAWSAD